MEQKEVFVLTVTFYGTGYSALIGNTKAMPYDDRNKDIFAVTKGNKQSLYFPGPNLFDIGKTNIINTTKRAKIIIDSIIKTKKQNKMKINVSIRGYNRGSMTASNIWDYLTNKYAKDENVTLKFLSKADEYGGPVNRLFPSVDRREYNNAQQVVCVYSLTSGRPFPSPTVSSNAMVVAFTNGNNNTTSVINFAAFHKLKKGKFKPGVYFVEKTGVPCLRAKVKNSELRTQQKNLHNFKKKCIFTKITDQNREEIFLKYYKKVDSGRRMSLFYNVLF
jgi:hypothetical protein